MNVDPQQAKAVFLQALENHAPEQWPALLDQVCADQPELRRRVEELLSAHDDAGTSAHQPGQKVSSLEEKLQDTELPGTVIGDYKLIERIGEGGMGEVWMAQQTAPVKRLVAVKLIRPGMDSKQVVARFEAERQALALMDHPNIARVFEGGTTRDEPGGVSPGRPYFVMELVKGVPITRFCDERRLTPRQRLELFVPVCQAIQHAHQKGIIHRDIKPSNVLVALYDDRPVPKVIDFGVAKATGVQLTEHTLLTGFGAIVGTVEYMSPEQANFNALDIDTRSDVYSLGVLLYELLTGTTPLTRNLLKGSSFIEVLRLVREEDPPRASTRLSTDQELATLAERRGVEPAKLRGLVRGEMDWIVMKALEKNRNRRYESAGALARDVERYLNDETVQACPPSAAYRFRKMAGRHKRALAMVAIVMVGLVVAVIGLAVSTVLTSQAKTRVEAVLAQEQLTSYYMRIGLAEREWSSNNLARAEELLKQCPDEMRGWEWRYLKRLSGKTRAPLRHGNSVRGCAIHPEGKQIASISEDGFLRVWDINTGEERQCFPHGLKEPSKELAYSPDGRRLASAEAHGMKVWDTRTWEPLKVWQAPSSSWWVQGLAYTPDGRLLGCLNETVNDQEYYSIWDLMSQERLFGVDEHEDLVMHIAISPDGTKLATASHDRTVRLWALPGGKLLDCFRGEARFWMVQFSPDGRLVAAGGHGFAEQGIGVVKIWDLARGNERPIATAHAATSLGFSPDGARLVTGGLDQTVKLWDTATGHEVLSLRGHTGRVDGVAFTPDGQQLVSASADRTIRIWDGRPWQTGDKRGEEVHTLEGAHADSVNAVVFHPREPRLATASADGTLKIWDARTWHWKHTFRVDNVRKFWSVAWSPDGKLLLVGGEPSYAPILLDAATGAEVRRLERHIDYVRCVAFSPDGKRVATGALDEFLRISDVTTGEVLQRLSANQCGVGNLAFSPDPAGRYLASVGQDSRVRIWDTQNPRSSPKILDHRGDCLAVAFNRDGRLLVSCGDRLIRVWDTVSGEQVQMVLDPSGQVDASTFSPDDRFVAWGGSDSTVKVWDRTTEVIHTLRGHTNRVIGLKFSPDGQWIVSASQDKSVKVWQVPR